MTHFAAKQTDLKDTGMSAMLAKRLSEIVVVKNDGGRPERFIKEA